MTCKRQKVNFCCKSTVFEKKKKVKKNKYSTRKSAKESVSEISTSYRSVTQDLEA